MLLSTNALEFICRKTLSRLLNAAISSIHISMDACYSLDDAEYIPTTIRYHGGAEGMIMLALSHENAYELASLFANRYRLATSFDNTDAILAEFLNIYAANVIADFSMQTEDMRIGPPEIQPAIATSVQIGCSIIVDVTIEPNVQFRFLHCSPSEFKAC